MISRQVALRAGSTDLSHTWHAYYVDELHGAKAVYRRVVGLHPPIWLYVVPSADFSFRLLNMGLNKETAI